MMKKAKAMAMAKAMKKEMKNRRVRGKERADLKREFELRKRELSAAEQIAQKMAESNQLQIETNQLQAEANQLQAEANRIRRNELIAQGWLIPDGKNGHKPRPSHWTRPGEEPPVDFYDM